MIKYLRRSLMVLLLVAMLFNTMACNRKHNVNVSNADNTDHAETTVKADATVNADTTVKADTADNADTTDKAETTNKAENTDKADTTDKAENIDNTEDINNTKSTKINDLKETENDTENDTNVGDELAYNKSKTLVENANTLNKILKEKYGKSLALSTEEDYEKAGQTDWTLVLEDNRVGIDTSTWKFNYDSYSDDSKYMDAILETFTFFCGKEMGSSLWSLTSDLLDGGADETLYGFEHNGSQAIYKNGNIAAYETGKNMSTIYIWLTPSEY